MQRQLLVMPAIKPSEKKVMKYTQKPKLHLINAGQKVLIEICKNLYEPRKKLIFNPMNVFKRKKSYCEICKTNLRDINEQNDTK